MSTATALPVGRVRRHRASALIVLGLVLAVAVVVLLGGAEPQTSTPLDPDNPAPDGARAVARVLEDRGVDVRVVRSADELEDTAIDGATVLVTSTDALGASTIERLREHAAGARLVLAGPGPGLIDALGLTGTTPSTVPVGDGLEAGCDDPLLTGLTVEVDVALAYPGSGCFARDSAALVVERDGLVLLGPEQALTNDQVLRADNAAIVVRLLGRDDELVWYVPAIDDLTADDGVSLQSLLPRWLRPALWLGAIAVLALVAWRVRRLGPLATEPLPVVVKAIETTRSRGRLYRRAGDRAHAAAVLRGAARTHAAELLRLGVVPDADVLARDVARRVGRPEGEILALLGSGSPAPATDKDLIALATELAALDREVRRT